MNCTIILCFNFVSLRYIIRLLEYIKYHQRLSGKSITCDMLKELIP